METSWGKALQGTAETRQMDLWPLVEEVMQSLKPLAEMANTVLKNDVPSDCILAADPELLRRAFQNLISNAIDYTAGGQVVVGAVKQPEGGVHCWVRDSGRGIPQDRLGKIFDRLETGPAKPGSFGLGLPIVKQIVEAHGGTVRVDSKPGEGTRFDLIFPGSRPAQLAS